MDKTNKTNKTNENTAFNEDIILKIKELFKLTNGNICNYCLGRKFSEIFDDEWVKNNLDFENFHHAKYSNNSN
jgi:hypothetical protein